jgi:hypothetical protein
MNGIAEHCYVVSDNQHWDATAVMQVKVVHEIAQCGTDVGSVLQQEAGNTEGGRSRAFTNQ